MKNVKQKSLFEDMSKEPLANRLRPETLEEYVGQQHLIGKGKILYQLINSDIVLREFTLNARGKQFHAFILYFDGMINTQMLNDFVLEPLMMRNKNNLFEGDQNKVVYESVTNNVTIRKVKKFNLSDYLKNCLIPQNDLKEVKTFSECFSGINSGNCALFVDTLDIAFDIEVKGFKSRGISSPNNEIVIRGPQEAFTEVNEIIKMMPDELVNKIPSKFRELIEDERDKEYNPNIQEPLEKRKLKNETMMVLAVTLHNYIFLLLIFFYLHILLFYLFLLSFFLFVF